MHAGPMGGHALPAAASSSAEENVGNADHRVGVFVFGDPSAGPRIDRGLWQAHCVPWRSAARQWCMAK
ncbi:hypothetical protein XOCgx_0824 [Xanthomonas oryzae pv. oryzicola]|nr:hypothetical protein XOCgx_0824 [Xanthomonas oryzae pv. oryzicola]